MLEVVKTLWQRLRPFAVSAALSGLAACSTLQAVLVPTAAPIPMPPASVNAPGAPPPTPTPVLVKRFDDVIRDAKELPGLFNLYQKEEKVWLEIKPDQFDTPFFLSINQSQGLGERGIYGEQMGRSFLVEFHKVGNLEQLL
jgi:hypothetical protein